MENFNEAGDAMFSVKAAEMPRRPRKVSKVITVLSFGIQGVALAFGPLALVQPLVATEVLFALPMIARRNRLPLRRKGIIGGLGVASGMAIFVAVSPPSGGVSVPRLAAWAPALVGIAAPAILRSRWPRRAGSPGLPARKPVRLPQIKGATEGRRLARASTPSVLKES